MRKNLFALSLAAFSVLLTACSSTEVPVAKKKEMSIVVEDVRTKAVNLLQVRLDALKTGGSISTAAMIGDAVNGPCTLYKKWQDTHAIAVEYKEIGVRKDDLERTINEAVKEAAQNATVAAYGRMKAGKSLSCKGMAETQLELFGDIARLMDQYGQPADTEAFDPEILRVACLREVKPEVQEMLATVKKYNENSDVLGMLENYVETAKVTWHFSPAEIGIPKDVIDRLGLNEDI